MDALCSKVGATGIKEEEEEDTVKRIQCYGNTKN
jgi:hypothetical protein